MSVQILADMASKLFATAPDWTEVSELGLPELLVPEDAGGFGGSWRDAQAVFRLAGYFGLDLPIVETILASALAKRPLLGEVAIADACEGTISHNHFSGKLSNVAWGDRVELVLAQCSGQLFLAPTSKAKVLKDQVLLGRSAASLSFDNAEVELLPWTGNLMTLAGAVITAPMAGAMDAALEISVGYANDREQFGKKIGKFQAVQQELAVFALEAAAANSASIAVFAALERGEYDFEAAASKLRCNMAASEATRISHQVHGAIGFTQDYILQSFTRQIWGWRSRFGSEAFWADQLGDITTSQNGNDFWSFMVGRDQG